MGVVARLENVVRRKSLGVRIPPSPPKSKNMDDMLEKLNIPRDKVDGLYSKYHISKTDGSSIDENALYFVLRLDTDPAARLAAGTYADATDNSKLAEDLRYVLSVLSSQDVL